MARKKRSLPTPITILVLVIILASVCTWIIPAGQYNKLKYDGQHSFVLSTPDGDVSLPAEQKTLDGISVDYEDWHFNVRSSNTEPLLRLCLESLVSREDMERRRDEVLAVIRS